MFVSGISQNTQAALAKITQTSLVKDYYLAGGKGTKLASKLDLACMKLEAIASRGIRRDFIDMYYLSREISLGSILSAAGEKFAEANISETHFLRSLVYFEDADTSEEPKMLVPYDWDEIKRYFENEVKLLTKAWGVGE